MKISKAIIIMALTTILIAVTGTAMAQNTIVHIGNQTYIYPDYPMPDCYAPAPTEIPAFTGMIPYEQVFIFENGKPVTQIINGVSQPYTAAGYEWLDACY